MPEVNDYRIGLLHLLRLLTTAPFFVGASKVEALLEAEGIDKALAERLKGDFEKMNELEIFNQGTHLISTCSDEYKIRAFDFLFRLSRVNKKIKKREIQLLQYACRLTTEQVLHVKLQLDEQKITPIPTHDVIYIAGGYEIDMFILEKLMAGYLTNIEVQFQPDVATAFAKLLTVVQKPKIIIVDVDPIRFTEYGALDQLLGLSASTSVYLFTLSKYLLGKTLKLSNVAALKGIFEKPLVMSDIQQIATENKLQFNSTVVEVYG